MSKEVGKLIFTVTPRSNGGEEISITTRFFHNGDPDVEGKSDNIFLNTEIEMQSYGNATTMTLCGNPLTPDILRDLAN